MNFFDTYELSGTATPPTTAEPSQSLNEEVAQVVGQLSRFWGGFRKQSQTVLEAARKDLGQVVQQAQQELTKLTTETSTDTEASTSNTENESENESDEAASTPTNAGTSSSTPSTSANSDDLSNASEPTASQPSQPQTLFSRLQASLPPSLVNTIQTQLPESLKETLQHARVGSANLTALDFAQLRSTITSELQRVQGATEEYVYRSEEFLRDAGEFLKDAVKVVPPEEGDSGHAGLIWDGTDVWMLPTTGGVVEPVAANGKGKGKERKGSESGRPTVDSLRAVATRAESMLKQLRHDPEVIKADPIEDGSVREIYSNWLATEVASEDRGLGTMAWQNRVERTLADPVDGSALKVTMDALVPETLTYDEFWTRYFFRVYQVEQEEARRKAIVQGTGEKEDDFSWEDDEEESTSPTMKLPPPQRTNVDATTTTTETTAYLSSSMAETRSRVSTPGDLSSRQSSEDSFDVVSSQVSNNGAADTGTIRAKAPQKASTASEKDEDEDEDEDDEEEENEEEEESDWE